MRVFPVVLLLATAVAPAIAQQFGPAESLAPYIPTPESVVDRMLESAHLKAGETLYDLGSGDGRVLIAAAQKYGAKAVGIELNADLCRKAEQEIKSLGLEDRVRVMHASALRADLSSADVVTMAFLTDSNERMRPHLEKSLRPGTRVISSEFPVKGWKPVEVDRIQGRRVEHVIYVYQMGKTR